MTQEEIAGLRARLTSLEQQTAALEARDTDDVTRLSHHAELKATRAELAAGEAQRQAETLRARKTKPRRIGTSGSPPTSNRKPQRRWSAS